MTLLLEAPAPPTPDVIYVPTTSMSYTGHAAEVALDQDSVKLVPRELEVGETYLVDYQNPLLPAEDFGRSGIEGALVAIMRAGTQSQPGYRPSQLLDRSSAMYWLVDRGTDYAGGDRFAVMPSQVRRGLDTERQVYGVVSNGPLHIGRRALVGAVQSDDESSTPPRASLKLESEHFTVQYDSKSEELAVTYVGDAHGYGASIVAHDARTDYEAKHRA